MQIAATRLTKGLIAITLAVAACSNPPPSAEGPDKKDTPPSNASVSSVEIPGGQSALEIGQSISLEVTVIVTGNAPTTVEWQSSEPAVASVDDAGNVSALAPGQTTISATSTYDQTKSASLAIQVVQPGDPEANDAPTARVLVRGATTGFPPLAIAVDGSASTDAENDVLTFTWNVSDGSTYTGVQASHVFGAAGVYKVTLIVTDARGASGSDSVEVVVGDFTEAQLLSTVGLANSTNTRHWAALDSNTALIPVVDADTGTFSHVDVYRGSPSSTSWTLEDSLMPTDPPTARQDVGRAVALSGTTAAIMSMSRIPGIGDVYESVIHIFERDVGGSWRESGTLLRGMGVGTDLTYKADISMALRDDVLVVGITSGEENDHGSRILIFLPDYDGPGVWGLAQEIHLPAFVPLDWSGWLGTDVAVSRGGERIAVAKSMQNNDGGIGRYEAVLIFDREIGASRWFLSKVLEYESLPSGYSTYVEIDGDTLAVTHMPTHFSTEVEVAILERDSGGVNAWGRVATHTASIPEQPVNAGPLMSDSSIRLMGNTLAVGIAAYGCSPNEDGPFSCGAGRVYIYGRNVNGLNAWGEAQVLAGYTAANEVGFGVAVDISSDERTVIVATRSYEALDLPPAEVFRFSR